MKLSDDGKAMNGTYYVVDNCTKLTYTGNNENYTLGGVTGGTTGGGSGGGMNAENNTNRPGQDYRNFDLSQASVNLCSDACASDPNCKAYTYVKPGVQGPNARCWLKSGVPAATPDSCCISGIVGADRTVSPPGGGAACTTLAGAWTQQSERAGTSTWHITASGEATESGLGNARGRATLSGRKLRIDWRTPSGSYSGYYEWELDSSCNSGSGVLVFTSGASGSQKSTVRK